MKYLLQTQSTTTEGTLLQDSQVTCINDNGHLSSTLSSKHTITAHNDQDDRLDEESDDSQLRGPENIAASASGNRIFSIAPGEGRLPTQILQDQDNEVCNND